MQERKCCYHTYNEWVLTLYFDDSLQKPKLWLFQYGMWVLCWMFARACTNYWPPSSLCFTTITRPSFMPLRRTTFCKWFCIALFLRFACQLGLFCFLEFLLKIQAMFPGLSYRDKSYVAQSPLFGVCFFLFFPFFSSLFHLPEFIHADEIGENLSEWGEVLLNNNRIGENLQSFELPHIPGCAVPYGWKHQQNLFLCSLLHT